jgi:hypothetical protein
MWWVIVREVLGSRLVVVRGGNDEVVLVGCVVNQRVIVRKVLVLDGRVVFRWVSLRGVFVVVVIRNVHIVVDIVIVLRV